MKQLTISGASGAFFAMVMVATASAAAQTPPIEPYAPAARAAPSTSTPYSDAYVPRSLRQQQPPREQASSGPVLLRFQAMQKLKKRFEEADSDRSGTLNREEARRAGLSVVDKNFDSIDTAQRGNVSFEDVDAYLVQRREEARAR